MHKLIFAPFSIPSGAKLEQEKYPAFPTYGLFLGEIAFDYSAQDG